MLLRRKPDERAEPVVLADQILPRLDEARQTVVLLRERVGSLVLDRELGKAGAARAVEVLLEDIAAAERSESQLAAALEAAQNRDAQAARERRQEIRLKNLADFEHYVAQRGAAAAELADHLAQATSAFHRLIDAQQGIPLMVPLDVELGNDDLLMIGEAAPEVLAGREMFRLGVWVDRQGMPITRAALPGAQAFDFNHIGDPQGLTPLVDYVAANNAALLQIVRDRVAALA